MRPVYPVMRRVARRMGYHLVRADYYSPIPDVEALPARVWNDSASMPGVDLRVDQALALLERELAAYLAEFSPPAGPPGTASGYHYANPMYGSVDGDVLYAMIRHLRPRRVLEIGAGYSTLVIADAAARNAADGSPVSHVVVDPYPADVLRRVADRIELCAQAATSLDPQRYQALQSGDVLFIDTTHTVKIGGDVLFLLLEVLPAVAPGVVVHVHDFFRPFEYPRVLFERFHVYWQEHYLLQAFLAYNTAFTVLMPVHAVCRLHPERVAAVVPTYSRGMFPSALWLRRTD